MTAGTSFRHEALLYDGREEFAQRIGGFVRDGLDAGEPVMVMAGAAKLDLLRSALGADAGGVELVDMEVAGRNPSRIIPAWRAFAERSAADGGSARGVGEPIWAARSPDELVECQTHESLINPAFADADGFTLVCPYDIGELPDDVIVEALRSHPELCAGRHSRPSPAYDAGAAALAGLDKPLPDAPPAASRLDFGIDSLHEARALVEAEAATAGLGPSRRDDLVLAVGEIAANSIRHGGGAGTLRVWAGPAGLVCEVADSGRIEDPMAGRVAPDLLAGGGRGLWIANSLCDLVQVRSRPGATVVRLHQGR